MANNLTGKRFGYLFVIKKSNDRGNGKKPVVKWKCLCNCGKTLNVKSDSLTTGHSSSCGCKKIKHNKANKERLYSTWKNMRQRCNNPNRKDYPNYGGRGISICDEWAEYLAFRDWALANGYQDTLSIDRIDVNGNYEPNNCRWVNNVIQANNVRTNRIIEYKKQKYTMSEFAKIVGISYSTLQHRLDRNWSLNRIVNTPQRSTYGT